MSESGLNVGLISYPMLFQRRGGLQVQIEETRDNLQKLGVSARLIDPLVERLEHYDVVHVFGASHGNKFIVQEANAQGVPVVVSGLIQPLGLRGRRFIYPLCNYITRTVSRFRLTTSYGDVVAALDGARVVVAQSEVEERAIRLVYGQADASIEVVRNGVASSFFEADRNSFLRAHPDLKRYVLVAGAICSYKNQLGVIEATRRGGYQVVLIGPPTDRDYLKACLRAGGGRVHYLGALAYGDPMLGSCFAAASVTVLLSQGETYGMVIAESLAAGTPAVVSRYNGLELREESPVLVYVDPKNLAHVEKAIEIAVESDCSMESCRRLVRERSWGEVARRLVAIYHRVVGREATVAYGGGG